MCLHEHRRLNRLRTVQYFATKSWISVGNFASIGKFVTRVESMVGDGRKAVLR
jgi:hypothetical protein